MSAWTTSRRLPLPGDADSKQQCFCLKVGRKEESGPRHIDYLRLRCGCVVHYHCVVGYIRDCIQRRFVSGGEKVVDVKTCRVKCPYHEKCKYDSSRYNISYRPSDRDLSNVYCFSTDEMEDIADYGLEDVKDVEDSSSSSSSNITAATAGIDISGRGSGGGGAWRKMPAAVVAKQKVMNAALLERLKAIDLAPLSREEVREFREWCSNRVMQDDAVRIYCNPEPKLIKPIYLTMASFTSGRWHEQMIIAARGGDLERVKRYCRMHSNEVINYSDQEGRTPLSWASIQGHLPVCKFLVQEGADIEHKDEDKMTPFSLAAKQSKWAICEFLVRKGASESLNPGWRDTKRLEDKHKREMARDVSEDRKAIADNEWAEAQRAAGSHWDRSAETDTSLCTNTTAEEEV